MSLDSDVIVDRRRIRRKLTFWRVAAVVFAIAAIVTVGVIVTPGGRGAFTASGSIARIHLLWFALAHNMMRFFATAQVAA